MLSTGAGQASDGPMGFRSDADVAASLEISVFEPVSVNNARVPRLAKVARCRNSVEFRFNV
ncbi:hypothetical protein BJ980_003322 [Nocardioides daedukensis]|uniref:Uncharacterized protein n=1 Tax=Nocardioides daedukensis TaxID=634462 RepID=A0A7Y9S606_9ACTN|nr:hypothetical protein [Nocardioides daedukensis]